MLPVHYSCCQSITTGFSFFFFSFFRKLTWVTIVTSALQSVMPVHYSCYQSITTGFLFFFFSFFSKIDLSNNCYQSITKCNASPLQLLPVHYNWLSFFFLFFRKLTWVTIVTSPLQLLPVHYNWLSFFFFSFFRKLTWVTIVTSALQSVMPVHYSCCQSITTGFHFFFLFFENRPE